MDGREERRHYEARGKKANQTGRDDSGDALIALNGPQRFPMRARERERERESEREGFLFPVGAGTPSRNVCKRASRRAKLWETRQVRGNPPPYRRQTPVSAIFIEAPSRQLTLPKVI